MSKFKLDFQKLLKELKHDLNADRYNSIVENFKSISEFKTIEEAKPFIKLYLDTFEEYSNRNHDGNDAERIIKSEREKYRLKLINSFRNVNFLLSS